MKTQFGEYQHYKGNVWITKQNFENEIQGTNVAIVDNASSTPRVLGYVIRKDDQWTHDHSKYFTLDEIVWSMLKSYGWYDDHCNELLGS